MFDFDPPPQAHTIVVPIVAVERTKNLISSLSGRKNHKAQSKMTDTEDDTWVSVDESPFSLETQLLNAIYHHVNWKHARQLIDEHRDVLSLYEPLLLAEEGDWHKWHLFKVCQGAAGDATLQESDWQPEAIVSKIDALFREAPPRLFPLKAASVQPGGTVGTDTPNIESKDSDEVLVDNEELPVRAWLPRFLRLLYLHRLTGWPRSESDRQTLHRVITDLVIVAAATPVPSRVASGEDDDARARHGVQGMHVRRALAQLWLGWSYQHGFGVTQDQAAAERLWKLSTAAIHPNARALTWLAQHHKTDAEQTRLLLQASSMGSTCLCVCVCVFVLGLHVSFFW